MKKNLLSISFSIIALLILVTITSFIFSLIHYKIGISINKYVVISISTILFFIAGFIYGLINKKQGLLGSLIFILVYIIYCLIDIFATNKGDFDNVIILFIAGKCVAYTCGAILGVNIKKH